MRRLPPVSRDIVPGGGIQQAKRQWIKVKGKYLFNEQALARVFRARFLAALNDEGFAIPNALPRERNWGLSFSMRLVIWIQLFKSSYCESCNRGFFSGSAKRPNDTFRER